MGIKAIIFDIGGVLYRMTDPAAHRDWEQRLNLTTGELTQIVFTNPLALQAYTAAVSEDEIWHYVAERLALSPEDLAMLRVDIWKGGAWDIDLLTYVRSLRGRYKLAIISDAWLSARGAIEAYVNESVFDVMLFSAEEGVAKPNPLLFQRALARLGVASQETIFIDDTWVNVEGAKKLGLHALHFTTPERLYHELKHILTNDEQ